MQIVLNDQIITVEVIRKKNKNIYMRFKDQNTLIITCNYFISKNEIIKIIKKNEKTLIKMQKRKEKESEEQTFFYYLGTPYEKIFDGKNKVPCFDDEKIFIKDEQTLAKWWKKECFRVFSAELERILSFFPPVPDFTLKVRAMKTRWGVNNQGSHTITLNSELLKKDLDLIDYVIIHELCHFEQPNHSPRFWACVAEYYPKYKEARKRLRT